MIKKSLKDILENENFLTFFVENQLKILVILNMKSCFF